MEICGEEELEIEENESEEKDEQTDTAGYKINTFGADFVLQTLVDKIRDKEIVIPPFQRRYVWNQKKASKLIESFLLGLPVPQIFLYRSKKSQSLLVVDGQQRLRTVEYYFANKFWDGKPFTLLDVRPEWEGKTFLDLEEADKRRLKNGILRATIFEQTDPNDNKSVIEIFTRLNTGGVLLTTQEIRNCLIRGRINYFLEDLNKYPAWRTLLGKSKPDLRMRDIEMMLRFFALLENWEKYKKPMKDFLEEFMEHNKDIGKEREQELSKIFKETMDIILKEIGERAFRIRAINVSIFDSIAVAIATLKEKRAHNLKESYQKLVSKDNDSYFGAVQKSTTDTDKVKSRIKIALDTLSK